MTEPNKKQQVAILDAGAQYAKVIDRRIRELAVESIILPLETPSSELAQYGAIIISGGPESVYGENAPKYNPDLFSVSVPIFGICYGMQLLNYVHGGTVEKKAVREDGVFDISVETDSLLFDSLDSTQTVLLTHGDTVDQVGKEFRVIAKSGKLIAGIEHKNKPWFGVQFHPEVDLSVNGKDILANFLFKVAKLKPIYKMKDREEKAIELIKNHVGDGYALVLVSGGVDSTVVAALVTKALGSEKVFALHIDHGFMRYKESEQVEKALRKVGLKLKVVDVSREFLSAKTMIKGEETLPLNETIEPEKKRKIIGDTFIKVSEKELRELDIPDEDIYLVQGTLRPDLIESASDNISKNANVIKTHHNDTELVRKLRNQGRVIEPLADYHKDEVRQLGEKLGLSKHLVWRHPFPGPGLAIRILCTKKPYIEDDFEEINKRLKKYCTDKHQVTLLPIQSVGVQGDGRTYSYVVAISGEMDWPVLFEMAKSIPKLFHKINRVVYLFGEKESGPVTEITPTKLNKETIEQLRQADKIVNEELFENDLMKVVSQVPVISLPLPFSKKGNRSIAIRTIITNDFMTGVPAVPNVDFPEKYLNTMVSRILKEVKGISRVVYDLTAKPPGTTEWE
ncbi:MAG: glutamine-hydrolyzing GMP synthase [Candidatus Pacebacteria bacterium]|nr:glutamine-hydrolyzing GMP synthase [Candidatus Paceibacterota bacterium]